VQWAQLLPNGTAKLGLDDIKVAHQLAHQLAYLHFG
jgi:hypothetical protein